MPFFVGAWHDKELDFHLLELTDAEQEVARVDFVAERLTDLGNTERQFAAGARQDIAEVRKDALGGLGAQICERVAVSHRADGSFEHHVEGARLGQIARATAGAFAFDMVGAPAAFAGAAVDEGVVEGLFVTRVLPDQFVHQNRGVETFHVVTGIDIGAPPRIDDVVFEFDAQRAVVKHPLQAAVDIRTGEDEPASFAQ